MNKACAPKSVYFLHVLLMAHGILRISQQNFGINIKLKCLMIVISLLPPSPRGPPPVCAHDGRCSLLHVESRHDGWGAQHIRRALLFVHARQLGCGYQHAPLTPFNARSSVHGVLRDRAEAFFGMAALGCNGSASRSGRHEPCTPFLPDQPEAHAAAPAPHAIARCGTTLSKLLDQWGRRHRGSAVHCEGDYGVPGLSAVSECSWLRAVAELRERYRSAHGGRVPLPWFTPPTRRQAGAAAAGLPPPLVAHAAIHIRRGDVLERDPGRVVRPERVGTSVSILAAAMTRVRSTAHGRRVAYVVHVMSQPPFFGGAGGFDAEVSAWRDRLSHCCNASLHVHLDGDAEKAMHHLIHADILILGASSFSFVASLYSAGVRLHLPYTNPIGHPFSIAIDERAPEETANQLSCELEAHLEYRDSAAARRKQADGSTSSVS